MSAPDGRCVATAELAAEIGDRFGFGPPSSWRDLGGSWTTNVALEFADGIRVARIHQNETSAARIEALQTVRGAVRRAGLPAAAALSGPDGATVITLADGWLAELEPYLGWQQRMNTPALLLEGFGILGRLHDILRCADVADAARTVRYANHVPAAEAAALTRTGADRIRGWNDPELTAFADRVLPHIEAVAAAEIELDAGHRQPVHGDFWDNNVGFTDGRLTALLDFDFMAERSRIDDLALPIWFYLLEPGHDLPQTSDQRFARALADAYDAGTTTPLSTAERQALPLAVARQPAWSVGRWVLELDQPAAVDHARAAAKELAVAEAVRDQLLAWQSALID